MRRVAPAGGPAVARCPTRARTSRSVRWLPTPVGAQRPTRSAPLRGSATHGGPTTSRPPRIRQKGRGSTTEGGCRRHHEKETFQHHPARRDIHPRLRALYVHVDCCVRTVPLRGTTRLY